MNNSHENSEKYALVIEYEGSCYHGWQRQVNALTVQQLVEEKLAILLGRETIVYSACRTDAGVHALHQVVHFFAPGLASFRSFLKSLNALLPDDISIRGIQAVSGDFHARYSARGKTYWYLIWNSAAPHPFLRRYSHAVYSPFDMPAMQNACQTFVGEHDFSAFRASSCGAHSPIKEIFSCSIHDLSPLLVFAIRGKGFLQHMVRIMAGTLIEVGRGKRSVNNVREVLQAKDRQQAGATAPAKGLTLVRIDYDPHELKLKPALFSIDLLDRLLPT